MADYTTLSDASVGIGGIPAGTIVTALRDNPIAISEGAVGAPQIQTAAITDLAVTNAKVANTSIGAEKLQTGATEVAWVGARTASLAVGAVGTYATLRWDASPLDGAPGTTVAGPLLVYTNSDGAINAASPVSPSGTWQLMGFTRNTNDRTRTSTWLRVS